MCRSGFYFGIDQLSWLEHDLKNSRATWKVISSDMPLGIIVPDGRDAQSATATKIPRTVMGQNIGEYRDCTFAKR